MIKFILITLTIFVTSFTVLCQENKPEIIKVGDNAPTFTIKTIDGQTFTTKELKGKVIYLNFFATWCGPCMKELPHIEKEIWQEIKHKDFTMLAIAREQKAELISAFKKEKGFTLPMAADETREIYNLFAPQWIPRNIVINREGKIIYTEKNYNAEQFNNMLSLIKNELYK